MRFTSCLKSLIYKALLHIQHNYKVDINQSIEKAIEIINDSDILQIEYLKVVNLSLDSVTEVTPQNKLIACAAVYSGTTRLIDNINLN